MHSSQFAIQPDSSSKVANVHRVDLSLQVISGMRYIRDLHFTLNDVNKL